MRRKNERLEESGRGLENDKAGGGEG